MLTNCIFQEGSVQNFIFGLFANELANRERNNNSQYKAGSSIFDYPHSPLCSKKLGPTSFGAECICAGARTYRRRCRVSTVLNVAHTECAKKKQKKAPPRNLSGAFGWRVELAAQTLRCWWRRGESNPRPQALRHWHYMLSRLWFV